MPLGLGIYLSIFNGGNVSSFDPNAQAFITAAGITNSTQQSALNTLVVDLKGYGIWTKMKAIYPFVGGTATTHKYNLINPADTDAAFRLVFSGGWTHSSNGATPNGTNGYADTKLTPSTSLSLNSTHISYYSRTNNPSAANAEIGAGSASSSQLYLLYAYQNTTFGSNNSQATSLTNITNTTGMLTNSRIISTEFKYYLNGSLQSTGLKNSTSLPTKVIYIGANNGPSSVEYSAKQVAFASIGDGLTATEAANLYTAVQAYQTTLGRQV